MGVWQRDIWTEGSMTMRRMILAVGAVIALLVGARFVQAQVATGGVTPSAGQAIGIDLLPRSVTVLNITSAVVLKVGYGRLARVSVIVPGAVGAIYDSSSTSGNTAANEIMTVPAISGMLAPDYPFQTGLTIAPGAGQTLAIAFY